MLMCRIESDKEILTARHDHNRALLGERDQLDRGGGADKI